MRSVPLLPLLLAGVAAAEPPAAPPPELDTPTVSRALVVLRESLPPGWEIREIRWESVPHGWAGPASAVLIRLEDGTMSFPHPREEFSYHPFCKLWLLPTCWEGRMAVSEIDPASPQALYLGENDRYRVLYRTLGRTTWPEAVDVVAAALELHPYPLTPSPKHSLDVGAMQRLWQRFESAGTLARWQRRIWGIEELPGLVYLELLTWEERTGRAAQDPTFLGDLAEKETIVLSREVLATFPSKGGLYLRRVTKESFSDVLVVNPQCLTRAP